MQLSFFHHFEKSTLKFDFRVQHSTFGFNIHIINNRFVTLNFQYSISIFDLFYNQFQNTSFKSLRHSMFDNEQLVFNIKH